MVVKTSDKKEIEEKYPEEIIKCIDKFFPKGNKKRGEALVLQAVAFIEGENQALLSQKQEFEKMIDEIENPYPIDIFPKLTQTDLDKVNALLEQVLKFPLDRLSAEMMRKARNNLKEELKQKLNKNI